MMGQSTYPERGESDTMNIGQLFCCRKVLRNNQTITIEKTHTKCNSSFMQHVHVDTLKVTIHIYMYTAHNSTQVDYTHMHVVDRTLTCMHAHAHTYRDARVHVRAHTHKPIMSAHP